MKRALLITMALIFTACTPKTTQQQMHEKMLSFADASESCGKTIQSLGRSTQFEDVASTMATANINHGQS